MPNSPLSKQRSLVCHVFAEAKSFKASVPGLRDGPSLLLVIYCLHQGKSWLISTGLTVHVLIVKPIDCTLSLHAACQIMRFDSPFSFYAFSSTFGMKGGVQITFQSFSLPGLQISVRTVLLLWLTSGYSGFIQQVP